jgi:hypothetical protein
MWETTSERQLGHDGVTNGRHLETIGRPILEDKWELWKAIERQLGEHIWETSGRQPDNYQQLKKPWRQLGDNIWETTSGRQLGDKWKTTRQQVEKPWRELAGGPDTTSQTGNKGRQTSGEPDATRHTGRQINC